MSYAKDAHVEKTLEEHSRHIMGQLMRFEKEVPLVPSSDVHVRAYFYGAITAIARFCGHGRYETFVLACRYFVENLGVPMEEVGEHVLHVQFAPQETVQEWKKEGTHAFEAWCVASSCM
ncbi:MAG: hypothetical protein IBX45_03545 [Campylobacterales bacterium]|nr:hypothetical protein [Campylobacterales bacterium]